MDDGIKRDDHADEKSRHHLLERMLAEYHACGSYHSSQEDDEAEPPGGVEHKHDGEGEQ